MAVALVSPGVLVREVDLTVGRADNFGVSAGAIAGPFQQGPVDFPITITNEQELISVFGKPLSTDNQYEYWMSASSFLSYTGILQVVRTDGSSLNNANVGVGSTNSTSAKIKNYDDYIQNYENPTNFYYAAKNPGKWGNDLKICYIDDFADQTIGIKTTNLAALGISVGFGVTTSITGVTIPGTGATQTFTGFLKGIITGVTTDATNGNSTIDVKIVSRVSLATTQYNTTLVTTASATAGVGTNIVLVGSTAGLNTLDTLTAPGLNNLTISSVGSTSVSLASTISSAIASGIAVTFSRLVTIGGTETPMTYSEGSKYAAFASSNTIEIFNNSGALQSTLAVTSAEDWYNSQTLGLTNGTIYWKTIAPKPATNQYVSDRSGRGDSLHIIVVDDDGAITGIRGNILERHVNLSKAKDAVSSVNSPQIIYYKDYLATQSAYIYAGASPSIGTDSHHSTRPVAIGFEVANTFEAYELSDGIWGQNAQGISFSVIGNKTYTLAGGKDYTSAAGAAGDGQQAQLADLITSYDLFKNKENIDVDILINGPGLSSKEASQAKANYLIDIAEDRKDCLAVISPHRSAVIGAALNNTSAATQTTNIIQFFNDIQSSSYAVFDSGYKYMYDRFNNAFRYIPCNADVAGLMARTDLNQYPWFSPAGVQRGIFNNAIKLAYNPNKAQRDALYTARVNPVVLQPGVGVLLFGDKTSLSYASAFDRINVRRLFLTIEKSLENAAKAQLFEFNDEVTRANFVNIVEPFLRDVQAKRGLYDFLVVCDTTNNTPDVIDNNEFRADIYIKPAKSINFISLTFVATRTGVSFSEVAGRV